MKKPFILGINGSPHINGRTAAMLQAVLKEAENRGARTRIVHLARKKILPHSGRLDPKTHIEKTPDDMPKLQRLVLAADGIAFASPTHWFSVSSAMKLFFDRLVSLEHYNFLLEGKVVGFIAYGPQGGALNAAMNMAMIANQMGMITPPYGILFNEGRNDEWFKKDLKLLAKNMIQLIRASKELKLNWGYPDSRYEVSPIELLKMKKKKR